MKDHTLFDALRADVRAKSDLIRSLYAVREGCRFATNAVTHLGESIQVRDEAGPDPERDRLVIADLLTVETLVQDLAHRIKVHKRAVEVGLFGADRPEHNT